ncbi:hypothetical protein HNQ91_000280 [Filimonas zeae]|uniref:ABC-type branched-chain amino acid transport system, substrate-binding protein n=1 Tax=Filimonas zeae TaxID=1737353 RepID=A0A917IN77_9BACT|nr:ABC transporter substrate-binding protein [Filimonas zeae]MDR6337258.1 hypothetical protein [Filimonas zeae]GGH57749.1 hypothetical protein GCM10011379_02740 [Filimonas zeae]
MTLITKSRVILAVLCCWIGSLHAQDNIPKPVRLRVAVLAPLYIDSAFNGYTYKLGTGVMPKYLLPGLEFYNGVMLAVDSLNKEKAPLEVWVYDTKKAGTNIVSIVKELDYLNFSLIIASVNNAAEQKVISEFSFNKNIPVISATYPNDAGVTANPFYIMVNSTLKTHVEGIYKYVQQNYVIGKMLYVTRKGALESKIQGYFAGMDAAAASKLKYKVVELPDNFTADQLTSYMDSTRQNIVICGSVNESFGTLLARTLNSSATSYRSVAVGMPTWDMINPSSVKNIEVVYSTPYNYSRTDAFGKSIVKQYKDKYQGKPTDMVFKGFESLFHFSKLMLNNKPNFLNNLSDSSYKIANDYSFDAVRLTSTSFVPDYLENKKLYFVKMQDGAVKSVN